MKHFLRAIFYAGIILLVAPAHTCSRPQRPAQQGVPLNEFVKAIRQKATLLETSSGMKQAFEAFLTAHQLKTDSVRYSDFVIIRLLYEATSDAGFWNVHWSVTDQPPNSDRIWSQWKTVKRPSLSEPTAIAECDELSALYAFLVERAGVKSVGLLWPTFNHTVAVWTLQPTGSPIIRVVVPTSQIFLEETDSFDTKKFNPWRQKTIYEYTRRDVPDTFELPKPLVDFFLKQVDNYAGASDGTLQRLRYVRDAVFVRNWTPEQAARDALGRRAALASGAPEDAFALQTFATDMRLEPYRR